MSETAKAVRPLSPVVFVDAAVAQTRKCCKALMAAQSQRTWSLLAWGNPAGREGAKPQIRVGAGLLYTGSNKHLRVLQVSHPDASKGH